jgi:hypothetical protein
MKKSEPNPLLRLYVEHAEAVLRERFRPDCCLNATRVGLECMTALRLNAEPLSVRCTAANRGYLEVVKKLGRLPELPEELGARAWCVAVDDRGDSVQFTGSAAEAGADTGWPGHLVMIVQRRWLVDGSTRQMRRPQRGLEVPDVLVAEVGDKFLRKKKPRFVRLSDAAVLYVPRDDRSFEHMPGFQRSEHNLEAAREILRRMRVAA